MNILFFLSPKQDLMYVYDDFTLRQTLEKWENNRYASIPILNRKGEYVGTLTEGDILWGLKRYHGLNIEGAEDIPIRSFERKRDYLPVTVNTSMDQLVEAAMNQNFVPVVDDRGVFIGIVRRQAIIKYCPGCSPELKNGTLFAPALAGANFLRKNCKKLFKVQIIGHCFCYPIYRGKGKGPFPQTRQRGAAEHE